MVKEKKFKGRKYRRVGLFEKIGRKIIGLPTSPPKFTLETPEYEEHLKRKFEKELGLLDSRVITKKRYMGKK